MVDVGKMIAIIRKKRKMSQLQLAQKINTTKQTISNYERGERKPDYVTLEAIADVLNVPVSMLISRDEQKKALNDIYGDTFDYKTKNESNSDEELWDYREQLRRDPERHILFSLARNGNIEDVRRAVAIIDALKKTSKGGNDDDPA